LYGVLCTRHKNLKDYWLVCSTHDSLYSYLIKDDEFTSPLISRLNNSFSALDNHFSFDGSTVAGYTNYGNNDSGGFRLLKFNTYSGYFSDPIHIVLPFTCYVFSTILSPDASKVYVFCKNRIGNTSYYYIYQADLSSWNEADILNSLLLISGEEAQYHNSILKIIDSKIYLTSDFKFNQADRYYLSVIENPNAKGLSCNFIEKYKKLSSISSFSFGGAYWGWHSSQSRNATISRFYTSELRLNTAIQFTLAASKNAESYLWDFGDIISGTDNYSSQKEPQHTYSKPGIYKVILITSEQGYYDTSAMNICICHKLDYTPFPDTNYCYTDEIEFNSNSPQAKCIWSTGESSQKITLKDTGIYWLELGSKDCIIRDTFRIESKRANALFFRNKDTVICEGHILRPDIYPQNCSFDWSSGDTTFTITPWNSGLYKLIAENKFCYLYDSINIKIDTCDFTYFAPNAFTPNGDGRNDTFQIFISETSKFNLKIFNQWGEKIFETNNPNLGWDGLYNGMYSPVGVYTYYFTAIYKNETLDSSMGKIHLIR